MSSLDSPPASGEEDPPPPVTLEVFPRECVLGVHFLMFVFLDSMLLAGCELSTPAP